MTNPIFSVILDGVKDSNSLKMPDYSLPSE